MNELLNGVSSHNFPITNHKQSVPSGKEQSQFADLLKNSINSVNNAQVTSNRKTEALASGQADELHDVMIAAQKASIKLETSVQVQQKMIDAYNEIMRMQV